MKEISQEKTKRSLSFGFLDLALVFLTILTNIPSTPGFILYPFKLLPCS